MYSDEEGNFAVLTFGIVALAATLNDIYQLVSRKVCIDEDYTDSTNVQIKDSYKILTPWVQFGYAFYLNHINSKTKDVIQGSTFGVQFEWMLHNIAYVAGNVIGNESIITSARSVDIGNTIYSDSHGFFSCAMDGAYVMSNLWFALSDAIEALVNLIRRKIK